MQHTQAMRNEKKKKHWTFSLNADYCFSLNQSLSQKKKPHHIGEH